MGILGASVRWAGGLLRGGGGSTALEYAFIAALISIAVLLSIFSDIATSLTNMFGGVVTGLSH